MMQEHNCNCGCVADNHLSKVSVSEDSRAEYFAANWGRLEISESAYMMLPRTMESSFSSSASRIGGM